MPPTDEVGDTLAAWGRVIRLTTRGRTTGRPVSTAVGFVEEPDGSLLVAAGSVTTDWARNLLADPRATASWGGREVAVRAEPLDGDAFAGAIRSLILRYGTPAENLGNGPAFRLRTGALTDHPMERPL